MSRRLLVLIHGYIAVFFLPLALLYAVTGGLYILGETGGDDRTTVSVAVTTPPQSAVEAIRLMRPELEQHGWRVPGDDEYYRELQGGYYWAKFTGSLRFTPTQSGSQWEIVHQRNHWYKQLVEIHKDHAGIYFSVLGFGFATGLFILIGSGAYMMFQSPAYRKAASILFVSGISVTAIVWLLSIYG